MPRSATRHSRRSTERLYSRAPQLLHLSFALAEANHLQRMLVAAGFREFRVEHLRREGIIDSFDAYWAPIEAGMGSMPQVYLDLPETERRLVKDQVRARLSQFESGGRLVMTIEMLLAV